MRVPQFDLAAQYHDLRGEVLAALDAVGRNATFVLGEEVERLEAEFAQYCGTRHCVALNSGTSALHLALLACDITEGDEVVTAVNTFTATAEAICYTGARPVFADIDPATGNIDVESVRRALTSRTRAIIPVHMYGRPANMGGVLELAEACGLAVIEDACQAHGARYRHRRVGGFGVAGAFSFYPSKNLGAFGEGGALTTDDTAVAERARSLRAHAMAEGGVHEAVGFNYRMDGFQGAILRLKLRRLPDWNDRRRLLAAQYRQFLGGARVDLPHDDSEDECVYHQFVVYVDDRDGVRRALAERGVETAVHYPIPLHLQPAYAELGYKQGDFPHAERAAQRVVSLPLFPEMSLEQLHHVGRAFAEVVGRS